MKKKVVSLIERIGIILFIPYALITDIIGEDKPIQKIESYNSKPILAGILRPATREVRSNVVSEA